MGCQERSTRASLPLPAVRRCRSGAAAVATDAAGLSLPNPLRQQYVFYNPRSLQKGTLNPAVVVDECVYEPRLVTPLPLAFFENISKAIIR